MLRAPQEENAERSHPKATYPQETLMLSESSTRVDNSAS
jgi:hypothetical protein